MSYDPKAKRPDTDDSEHAAPVDQLLGAAPEEASAPGRGDAPTGSQGTEAAMPSSPAVTPAPTPLPDPVTSRLTVGTAVAAAVAVVIVLIGWRRRRRGQ